MSNNLTLHFLHQDYKKKTDRKQRDDETIDSFSKIVK